FVQGIIMLIGIIAVIASVISGRGGFTEALTGLAKVESDVATGVYSSFFGPDPLGLLWVVILTSLGTWGLPQMVHKFYAIKDEQSIKTGTVVSTVFAIIVARGSYFLGGFGRLFGDSSAPFLQTAADGTTSVAYDGIIPHILSTSLSDILIGVVVVLVLSASMSTLSSLVLTSSSTLTLDFLKDNFIKNMNAKKQMITIRVLVFFFVVLSVVIALDPPAFIAQLMGISWGALAGAFLAPFLYGLYWKRVSKIAVWASFCTGVGITVLNMFFSFFDSPITAGAIAMLAGLVVVPLVSLVLPDKDRTRVNEIFTCYDETVVVKKKSQLSSK
ncbi:MAG: sodium:solute symporter, partial [Lachnospiraceae bacterium]|nr:sodium:solute symporter [Lachnospiraceae bacterium]